MSCDFSQLPHAGIQSLSPYVPGKTVEEVAKEYGASRIIKLGSNENPLGSSPHVLTALSSLTPQQIATYPLPLSHPLSKMLADKLNIDLNMITLSHGSDALFQLLIIGYALHRSKHILTHEYAFQTYQILAKLFDVPLVTTPLRDDWQVDIDAMIKACNEQTALIFLANPNNPTGGLLNYEDILRLLKHIPETTILVLDEAYYEYLRPEDSPNAIQLLQYFPNLFITRTFSKAYGLAGLRLGYSISNPIIHELLHKISLPFTINLAALTAGKAALEDGAHLRKSVELIHQELPIVREALFKKGYSCMPSWANFITFRCQQDSSMLYINLLRKGVIVRPLHPYGLTHFLRVTIGTPDQNRLFLDALPMNR
jgi:histidinol-phosphate aminotransferase